MELATIPRTVVCQGLRGLRLPLDLVESAARLTGVDVDERWGPSVAFEGFEGEAKRLAGTLLGDHELLDQGLRQRARVEELRRSAQAQAIADGTRARSEARVERARGAAQQQRRAIADAAREVESSVDDKRRRARQRVAQKAEEREERVDEADGRRAEVVGEVTRAARRHQLAEESAALHGEERAAVLETDAEVLAEAEQQLRLSREESD